MKLNMKKNWGRVIIAVFAALVLFNVYLFLYENSGGIFREQEEGVFRPTNSAGYTTEKDTFVLPERVLEIPETQEEAGENLESSLDKQKQVASDENSTAEEKAIAERALREAEQDFMRQFETN